MGQKEPWDPVYTFSTERVLAWLVILVGLVGLTILWIVAEVPQ